MGRPKPPDPMQVAQQQQGFNRESQADAAQLGSPTSRRRGETSATRVRSGLLIARRP